MANTARFRKGVEDAGLRIIPGIHPIVPIMFRKFENDAVLAQEFAKALYEEGIYAVGFFFPVVPKGAARIRIQISAAHTAEQIERALTAFAKVGRNLKVIS